MKEMVPLRVKGLWNTLNCEARTQKNGQNKGPETNLPSHLYFFVLFQKKQRSLFVLSLAWFSRVGFKSLFRPLLVSSSVASVSYLLHVLFKVRKEKDSQKGLRNACAVSTICRTTMRWEIKMEDFGLLISSTPPLPEDHSAHTLW